METVFNDIDALILSVIHQNNQFDLVQWIGMIDCYERIILTFDEFSTSLEKLQKCGLIEFSNGKFILHPETVKLFPKRFHIRGYEKIYAKLSKKECMEIADSRLILSEEEYEKAFHQYKKMAKRSYAK